MAPVKRRELKKRALRDKRVINLIKKPHFISFQKGFENEENKNRIS